MNEHAYPRLSRVDLVSALSVSGIVVGSLIFAAWQLGRFRALPEFPLPEASVYGNYLMAAGAAVTALLIAWLVRGHVGARLLALHLAFITMTSGLMLNATGQPSETQRILGVLGGALTLPAIVHFTLLFPHPLRPSGSSGWRLGGLRSWLAARPVRLWLLFLPYGVGLYALHRAYGSGHSLMMADMTVGVVKVTVSALSVWMLGAPILGGLNLLDGYRAADAESRVRVLWVVLGYAISALIGVGALALTVVVMVIGPPAWSYVVSWVWWIALPVATLALDACLLFAVFGAGAFNPAEAVRRTAVYGGVAVSLTFLFAGIEEVLSSSLFQPLGLPAGVSTWVGAGCVALALNPVKNWVDRLIGHAADAAPGNSRAVPDGDPS